MGKISKILSANDTGETGAHMAGILVPKDAHFLGFFPRLNHNEKNPRSHILVVDQIGKEWEFSFIYYNNRKFGGTRNEYRLTKMTKYIRESNLCAGDELIFTNNNGVYSVDFKKNAGGAVNSNILKLGSKWTVVKI